MKSPRSRLRSVLRSIRERPAIEPARGLPAAGPVRSLPGWVDRARLLPGGGGDWWLLCDPVRPHGEAVAGQFVFGAPSGRFMVDTFDTMTGACVAQESAEGGPLVAGLVFTGHPVLLHIRPLDVVVESAGP